MVLVVWYEDISVILYANRRLGLTTNLMCSRFYESIISQVSADVGLDDFSADSISRNEIFIVALRALKRSSSHGLRNEGKRVKAELSVAGSREMSLAYGIPTRANKSGIYYQKEFSPA